jgi:HTH-type transcriptional regulator, quorum sensing regulator NprR
MMKKIRQDELAKGICSISYLSKIENGKIQPSSYVVDLLLKKLGCDVETTSDEELNGEFKKWYLVMLKKQIDESQIFYNKFNKESLSDLATLTFHILSILHHTLVKNFQPLPKYIAKLKLNQNDLTLEQKYLLHQVLGYYFYGINKLDKSLSSYEQALNLSYSIVLSDFEKAELYYGYSLTASRLNNTIICLKFTQLALSLYQTTYHLYRCIDCHILLGISYKRLSQINESITQYNKALELAISSGYESSLAITMHNLGNLYSVMEDSDKAISFYQEVLTKKLTSILKAQVILSLVSELYKKKRIQDAKYWYKQGLQIVESDQNLLTDFKKEYVVYKYLLEMDYAGLHKIMIDDMIPFLEKQKKHEKISYYCRILGEYFYTQGMYKNSSNYYSTSLKYYKKSTTTY